MHQQQTKIGPAHGTPHRKVWIEGRHLKDAGFSPGDRYDRQESGNILAILRKADGSGRYKVAGKGDKPILDISGSIIPRLFPPPSTHVQVSFSYGSIIIKPVLP